MDDVFDVLAEKLKAIPDEVSVAYKEASIKAINEAGDKLKNQVKNTSPSAKLADHIKTNIYHTNYFYTYEVDWSDELVNPNHIPATERVRKAGKRDYRIAPATWHDLAYILNTGVKSDNDGHTIKPPTYFITRAWRNAKTWKTKRDLYFNVKLTDYGNKFDDFKTYKKDKR